MNDSFKMKTQVLHKVLDNGYANEYDDHDDQYNENFFNYDESQYNDDYSRFIIHVAMSLCCLLSVCLSVGDGNQES